MGNPYHTFSTKKVTIVRTEAGFKTQLRSMCSVAGAPGLADSIIGYVSRRKEAVALDPQYGVDLLMLSENGDSVTADGNNLWDLTYSECYVYSNFTGAAIEFTCAYFAAMQNRSRVAFLCATRYDTAETPYLDRVVILDFTKRNSSIVQSLS